MNPTRLRAHAARRTTSDAARRRRHGAATRRRDPHPLGYRPPYDVAAMLRFLSLRAIPDVELVDVAERRVRRSVRAGSLADAAGWIEAQFDAKRRACTCRFAPELGPASGARRRDGAALARPRRRAADDRRALVGLPGAPGLRLPGSVDAFELAVRAVLGQQVTVAAARTLARRFADRFGADVVSPWPQT